MSQRRRLRAALAPTGSAAAVPAELLECVVEDWSPADEAPADWWHAGSTHEHRPPEQVIREYRELRAWRRWKDARTAYRAEHNITDPWPIGRPRWRACQ
jgi:hypothetical protein